MDGSQNPYDACKARFAFATGEGSFTGAVALSAGAGPAGVTATMGGASPRAGLGVGPSLPGTGSAG